VTHWEPVPEDTDGLIARLRAAQKPPVVQVPQHAAAQERPKGPLEPWDVILPQSGSITLMLLAFPLRALRIDEVLDVRRYGDHDLVVGHRRDGIDFPDVAYEGQPYQLRRDQSGANRSLGLVPRDPYPEVQRPHKYWDRGFEVVNAAIPDRAGRGISRQR
jgi:hypothetical protein